jgi:phage terminase large subunit GpA-like protein
MASATLVVRRAALRALVPPAKIDFRQWAESTIRLPGNVSAEPGRLRMWAYQRGIADAIGDPSIERVTLVKSVRIGLSTLHMATIANYVANDPSNVMLLLPTEADCRDYSVTKLDPIFEATPKLRGLLSDSMEGGRNTIKLKLFAGGLLKIVSAKSPRNLRGHDIRILLIDEADAMEITPEGDPLTLAERRTLSFPNRKIILGSTPVFEDTSNVLRSYAASDQRIFEVPCPDCGAFFEIMWEHIDWPEGEPEKASCRCPHCEAIIPESRKLAMVEQGAWRATAPHVRGHAGFRINALVSTLANAAWGKLATELLEARKAPDKLQGFVNTILGQGWKQGEEIDDSDLAARAEPFGLALIPTDVRIITAGVDVQHDRLECTLVGWTADGAALTLAHDTFWGDVQADDVWAELDDHIKQTWAHPLGGRIGVSATAVDSGDGQTTEAVVAFCKARWSRRVVAIKGAFGEKRPVMEASGGKARLWIVGVDAAKGQIFKALADRSAIRFSRDLPPVWYEQFASERRIIKYRHGRPEALWERIKGRRAEALDCFVYAWAARRIVNVDMIRRENELRQIATAPAMPANIPSRWMHQGRP